MSEQSSARLIRDRKRGLIPRGVDPGVEFYEDLRGLAELIFVTDICRGLYTEMTIDGKDHRTKIGLRLLAIRTIVDTLEVRLDHVRVDQDGVLIDA